MFQNNRNFWQEPDEPELMSVCDNSLVRLESKLKLGDTKSTQKVSEGGRDNEKLNLFEGGIE
jgi:hypothetical protein